MILLIILLSFLEIACAEVNFVAGGFDSGSGGKTMAWSQDGTSWMPITPSSFLDSCNGLAYSSTQRKWLALGSGTNTMAYSLDGKNWVGMGVTVFPSQGNRVHFSSNQNRWVATGTGTNNIAYSPNGEDWNYSATVFTTEASDVVHAPILGRWVAVGSGAHNIAHSPDGITWTGLGASIFGFGGQGFSIDFETSNTQFIVGGLSSSFPYGVSTDGLTWTGSPGLFSNQVHDAAYGQGKWIITGPATPLPTPFANSSDAVSGSWTVCAPQTVITNGRSLVYHSQYDRWVAVGFGSNSAFYSSDGIDWTGTGNPFQTAGVHVATTGTFLVLPPNQLNGLFTGTTITNSSTISNNSTVLLQGSLIVTGDLYVLGNLTFNDGSLLNITETLTITGDLTFQISSSSNSTEFVNSQILLVDGGSLTLILTTPLAQDTTIVIAHYGGNAGTFESINVLSAQGEPQCMTQTPQYGATSLSITISVTACPVSDVVTGGPSSSTPRSGFPIWAIALTAVLAVLAGVAVSILIVILIRRRRRELTRIASADCRKRELENMQSLSRISRNDPSPNN